MSDFVRNCKNVLSSILIPFCYAPLYFGRLGFKYSSRCNSICCMTCPFVMKNAHRSLERIFSEHQLLSDGCPISNLYDWLHIVQKYFIFALARFNITNGSRVKSFTCDFFLPKNGNMKERNQCRNDSSAELKHEIHYSEGRSFYADARYNQTCNIRRDGPVNGAADWRGRIYLREDSRADKVGYYLTGKTILSSKGIRIRNWKWRKMRKCIQARNITNKTTDKIYLLEDNVVLYIVQMIIKI